MIHTKIKVSENGTGELSTYILDGENKIRPAVLVLPGGGYHFTSLNESEQIALQFMSKGYHAFVLHYTVNPQRHPMPIYDVSNALKIIREKAEEWRVDTDKIAVCGFSAGGHLAASIGVFWDADYLSCDGKNKPNALILAYPVITADRDVCHRGSYDNLLGANASQELRQSVSVEKFVSSKTPQTFLWHTVEDTVVPVENSLMFANSLRKNNIPFEMHIYPKGHHGLSLCTNETGKDIPHIATWMDLCIQWLSDVFSAT